MKNFLPIASHILPKTVEVPVELEIVGEAAGAPQKPTSISRSGPYRAKSNRIQVDFARLLLIPHQPHTAAAALFGGDGMIEETVTEVDAQGFFGVQAG